MPTGLKAYLEPPGVCGYGPAPGSYKKGHVPESRVRRAVDKYQMHRIQFTSRRRAVRTINSLIRLQLILPASPNPTWMAKHFEQNSFNNKPYINRKKRESSKYIKIFLLCIKFSFRRKLSPFSKLKWSLSKGSNNYLVN